MKKYFNKFTMSILMVGLSLLTMVATTYAWVGLLSNSTLDNFNINLRPTTEDDSEYGIMMSLSGYEGTFSDAIDEIDLQKQLLINLGYDPDDLTTEGKIRETFRKLKLNQCTVTRKDQDPTKSNYKKFGTFTDARPTNKVLNPIYFQFDLYIMLYRKNDDGSFVDESTNYLDVYLRNGENGLFQGTTGEFPVVNEIKYPTVNQQVYLGGSTTPSYILDNGVNSFALGQSVLGNVKIDSSSACRIAFQKFPAVDAYDVAGIGNTLGPKELFIYQTGGYTPSYDPNTGRYDFGGVLPSDYNFSRLHYNSLYDTKLGEVPQDVINRGDVLYVDDGDVNHLVDETDHVTTEKMVKFVIYFWFEGWDADCFNAMDSKNVSIYITLSNVSPIDDDND